MRGSLIFILLINIFCNNQLYADYTKAEKLVKAAINRTKQNIKYDGSYYQIDYPMGDVPGNVGVCTDVIIRSYRKLGLDLQQKVHEDMAKRFNTYPKLWGLTKPDPNIDHRRVPNLQVFFSKYGKSLPVSDNPANYKPGDIVTWNIVNSWGQKGRTNGFFPHIGIVTNIYSNDGKRPMIVHNIGAGPKLEDALFTYEVIGHYRYL